MRFFAIFGIVFCGGTILVSADYYIEFQRPAGSTSSGVTVMADYLYQCKGVPKAMPAFTAARSLCTAVTDIKQKVTIHATCTFYSVERFNLPSHIIHFSDGGTNAHLSWNLGYKNHAIDHPNFSEPTKEDVAFLNDKLDLRVVDDVVPEYLVKSLATYFAQNNLISLCRNPSKANALLSGFAFYLSKLVVKYREEAEEANLPIRSYLAAGMKMALHKMIDPCSVLLGYHQIYASQYCASYCDFINTMARHIRTPCSKCSSLQGGRCVGAVCTCNRVLNTPFQGCNNMQSPMRQCNNVVRAELIRHE